MKHNLTHTLSYLSTHYSSSWYTKSNELHRLLRANALEAPESDWRSVDAKIEW